jgi:hypothetical protein
MKRDEEQDRQFAGFGRAVVEQMLALRNGWIDFNEDDQEQREEYSAIIAHSAYSLAYYVLERAEIDLLGAVPSTIIKNIPDLDVLPEDEESILG